MKVANVWYGQGVVVALVRATLSPFAAGYRAVVSIRNALYDRGLLRTHESPLPVASVGNITVGGTGKTPFTAYIVQQLRAEGHVPAVVMRGYGDDERHLHARMNPGIIVITGADRVAGIRQASAAGADVVVMDDAFQHRRAGRDLDIVLVSAERWAGDVRLLPAGPLREPLRNLQRADIIVVTRKSATEQHARDVAESIRSLDDKRREIVIATLEPTELIAITSGERKSLDSLSGSRVLAVAGIGDPASFYAQLTQLGATVVERSFRDHHDYTEDDAAKLSADQPGHKYVLTTEKDAVKLSRVWPANGPVLWYLSQAVRLTEGSPLVAAALAKLFKRATLIAG